MGPGVVILLWLFLAGIYLAAVVGFGGLCFFAWRKGWKVVKWVSGAVAGALIAFAVFVIGIVAWGFLRSFNPENVFEDTFGAEAAAQVTNIQSDVYWFADTGSVFLRFHTTQQQFLAMVPEGMERKNSEQVDRETPSGNDSSPKWWDYRLQPDWIYFFRLHTHEANKPGRKGFYFEVEIYAYNPNEQAAYYSFLGID